jgi:hypothetical protein
VPGASPEEKEKKPGERTHKVFKVTAQMRDCLLLHGKTEDRKKEGKACTMEEAAALSWGSTKGKSRT